MAFGYVAYNFAQPDFLQGADGENVTIFGLGADAVVGIGALLLGWSDVRV